MDIKKEYKKQRDRVLGLVRRYKKRGYYVDIKIPKIPKEIKEASIRRLAKITPEKVRKNSYLPDIENGEVKGKKYYELSNKARKQMEDLVNVSRETFANRYKDNLIDTTQVITPLETVSYSDVIIDNFIDYISEYVEPSRSVTLRWLEIVLSLFNREDVARALEEGNRMNMWLTIKEAYDACKFGSLVGELDNMLDFLDIGELTRESIYDAYQENDLI